MSEDLLKRIGSDMTSRLTKLRQGRHARKRKRKRRKRPQPAETPSPANNQQLQPSSVKSEESTTEQLRKRLEQRLGELEKRRQIYALKAFANEQDLVIVNRDNNAAKNLLWVGLYELEHGVRLAPFARSATTPSAAR